MRRLQSLRRSQGSGGGEDLNRKSSQIGADTDCCSVCRRLPREPVSLSLACLSCSRRKARKKHKGAPHSRFSLWKFIKTQTGEAVIPFFFTFGDRQGGLGGDYLTARTRSSTRECESPTTLELKLVYTLPGKESGQTWLRAGLSRAHWSPFRNPEQPLAGGGGAQKPKCFCCQDPVTSAQSRSSCEAQMKMDGEPR